VCWCWRASSIHDEGCALTPTLLSLDSPLADWSAILRVKPHSCAVIPAACGNITKVLTSSTESPRQAAFQVTARYVPIDDVRVSTASCLLAVRLRAGRACTQACCAAGGLAAVTCAAACNGSGYHCGSIGHSVYRR
jgi:hypothetical protein